MNNGNSNTFVPHTIYKGRLVEVCRPKSSLRKFIDGPFFVSFWLTIVIVIHMYWYFFRNSQNVIFTLSNYQWWGKVGNIVNLVPLLMVTICSYKEILKFINNERVWHVAVWSGLLTFVPLVFFHTQTLLKVPVHKFEHLYYAMVVCVLWCAFSLFCYQWVVQNDAPGWVGVAVSIVFLFWNAVYFFCSDPSWRYFVVMFLITAVLTDINSQIFGNLGSIKISNCSPNKTLEGVFGGVVVTSVWVGSYIFYLWQNPQLTNDAVIKIQPKDNIFVYLALIQYMSFGAIMGDLFFSKVKRTLQIKNFGDSLGFFGGFWDRFDSHAFVFILVFFANFIISFVF